MAALDKCVDKAGPHESGSACYENKCFSSVASGMKPAWIASAQGNTVKKGNGM